MNHRDSWIGKDVLKLSSLLFLLSVANGIFAPRLFAQSPVDESPELKKVATWIWPNVEIFEEHLLSYIDQRSASEQQRQLVQQHWSESESQQHGPDFIERLLTAAGIVDPRIKDLHRELLDPSKRPVSPGDLPWLTTDVPGWLQDTVRLATGRALAPQHLFDEALEVLGGLEIGQVADPATLIFYRAVCEHNLLQKEECVANTNLLMERRDELPNRYAQVAKLIQADISPLKEDSLDEVSRLMNDVQRRLDLGRVGTRVRKEEQQVVDKLEKLVDKLEKQLQQQRQNQKGKSGGSSPSQGELRPMEDSKLAGGSGPGDVENKEIGQRAGWGNLPPAQRQEALQRLTEELPSHYREVIEGYFRQMAKDKK